MKNIRFTSIIGNVLIAAVAILVVGSIILPLFAGRFGRSPSVTLCLVNLHSLGTAMNAYRDDWDSRFPDPSVASVWGHGSRKTWAESLYHYHKKIETYRCYKRDVNFAYAMNDRLGDKDPRSPHMCIAIYECPGCGNSAYRVNPDKDNWRGWWGREIGWATGNAGLSGSRVRKVPENTAFDKLSCAPRDISRAMRKPSDNCADLVFPGPHGGYSNCVIFCDGYARTFDQWDDERMTFDPDKDYPQSD